MKQSSKHIVQKTIKSRCKDKVHPRVGYLQFQQQHGQVSHLTPFLKSSSYVYSCLVSFFVKLLFLLLLFLRLWLPGSLFSRLIHDEYNNCLATGSLYLPGSMFGGVSAVMQLRNYNLTTFSRGDGILPPTHIRIELGPVAASCMFRFSAQKR